MMLRLVVWGYEVVKSRAGLLVSQWHAAKGGQVASCLGFDSEWPMDEYLIVVCGIMLFGG